METLVCNPALVLAINIKELPINLSNKIMNNHRPVLLEEAISGLAIKANGVYIDGTFGRGGHSRAILSQLNNEGRLIAIDKDEAAINFAHQQFAGDKRFSIIKDTFANISKIAHQYNVFGKIQGILLDLGVSSPQLDDPNRGFSFTQNGPLDMRMDLSQDLDARYFINNASAEELAAIFKEYGEERFARRIANAIINARNISPITTTDVLAQIVKAANPRWEKHKHPATRVFQAIRIHVNQELQDLKTFLKNCLSVLALGGRLVIISFHSLEDRIVKQFMRDQEKGIELPRNIPIKASNYKTCFKRVGKAIKPNEREVIDNVRARSAVLRIGEKIA